MERQVGGWHPTAAWCYRCRNKGDLPPEVTIECVNCLTDKHSVPSENPEMGCMSSGMALQFLVGFFALIILIAGLALGGWYAAICIVVSVALASAVILHLRRNPEDFGAKLHSFICECLSVLADVCVSVAFAFAYFAKAITEYLGREQAASR